MKAIAKGVGAVFLIGMISWPTEGADLSAGSVAGTITYISGGIGEAEQEQFVAREKEFNLKLVFSLIEGNYVADVGVVVNDAKGRKIAARLGAGAAEAGPDDLHLSASRRRS